MIDNVVFISDVQQSGSVIHIPITILFQILSLRLLQNIDPLEKGMATHSSILAWEIPWTEEPGGLQSLGLQRVTHN